MRTVGFEHLHLHSEYSLLDGFGKVEEYAEHWHSHGQFLCVSDHGMLGAVPNQIKACDSINEKHGKGKLSPIFGCELYVNRMHTEPTPDEESRKKFMDQLNPEELAEFKVKGSHLLTIATSKEGYSNLVQLSSYGFLKGFYSKPRVNYEMLQKHKEGLIFTSCCYASEIGRTFDKKGEEAAEEVLVRYMEMFKNQFYLEIMMLDFKKQKPYDVFILKMKDKYNLPIILTNDCFVSGTMVATKEGSKPIEKISVGDEVLTHLGNFKKVIFVNNRDLSLDEKVYSVKTNIGTYSFEATGNHPVYVLRDNIWQWISVENIVKKDVLRLVRPECSQLFSSKDLKQIDLFNFIDNEIILKYYDKNKNAFITHRGTDHRNTITIPRIFKVTDDFLRVLGIYLAEGSVHAKSEISFGTHITEKNERQLLDCFFSIFGFNINNDLRGANGIATRLSSVVLNPLFESLCGKGAKNKKLPGLNACFKLSSRQMAVLIGQYIDGDGSKRKTGTYDSWMIGSTSINLIESIRTVFAAWGIAVARTERNYTKKYHKHKNKNANSRNWNTLYVLNINGRKLLLLKKVFNGEKYHINDDDFTATVKSVDLIPYTGKVYNMQVEGEETYTANGWAVHNCHYCKQEDSHYQRLMLMIQTKRTLPEIQKMIEENENQDFFELQDSNLWMKTEEELNEMWETKYSDVIPLEIFEEAKRTTVDICQKAKGVELDRSIKFPVQDDEKKALAQAIADGLRFRNIKPHGEYGKRVAEEYDIITRKGFASYFLVQKMMTDEARRVCPELLGWGDGREAVGPGRGSGGGSLVLYLLGVTDVDPIRHKLLFSRFLSEARGGKQIVLKFSK